MAILYGACFGMIPLIYIYIYISHCILLLAPYYNIKSLALALLFRENPQAVSYSAQPLCWSGSEPGTVRKDGAEIP